MFRILRGDNYWFRSSRIVAALTLLENGKKPLFWKGKDVEVEEEILLLINIMKLTWLLLFWRRRSRNYSDGKVYTRSKKRGSIINILETLVFHGAKEEILFESQPHIGTNKLPNIIANIRQTILSCGGEIHFNTKVVDFIITNNSIKGVVLENKHKVLAKNTILATGHSARDIFYLLNKRSIEILNKPFAMGIRIEHPQELIDQIQYSCNDRGSYLPPASYKLVTQINNRGVYSFCMCPGGFIVPASTNKGEIVVNGMSPSKRNSFFSNSGIVVEVKEEDLFKYKKHGNLKGLKYQIELEKSMCKSSPDLQIAPAQKMIDFINKKTSNNLNKTSYQPGLISEPLHEILPKNIVDCLSGSFNVFGKKMKGFLTNEANIIGLESRTSSPLSIPRDNQTLQHIKIKNLFPCGEGAGYAGGIVSAAIDGKKVAEKI